MKRTLLFTHLIISSIIILTSVVFTSCQKSNKSENNSNEIIAQLLNDSAKSIQFSNPDSAISLYHNAIKILKDLPHEEKINYQLGMTLVDLATVYITKGDYEKSIQFANEAITLQELSNIEIQARVLTLKGQILMRQGELDSAMVKYNQGWELAKQIKNKKILAKILSNKGIINGMRGNYKQAEKFFSSAYRIGLELNDKDLISGGFINLGIVYQSTGDYQKAIKNYLKDIEYSKQNNFKLDISLACQNLGNVYYMMEDYSNAISYYQQALKIAQEIDYKEGIAKNIHNIAEVYTLLGDKELAIKAFMQSIKIKEKISDKTGISADYRSIGTLYLDQKNYSKALYYYQQALSIDSTAKLVHELAGDYMGLTNIYGEMGNETLVVECGKKSVAYYKQIDNVRGVSEVNGLLGSYYARKKQYSLALNYFQTALTEKLTLTNESEGLASLYNQFSDIYLQMSGKGNDNYLKLAIEYGRKSYEIASQSGIPYLLSDAGRNLAKAYKKSGDYRQAYHYLEINKQYNDSMFNKSKAEALTFAEARWNNEKNRQQITTLKKLNEATLAQKLAEEKTHRIILGSLIVILLMLFLTGYFLWRFILNKNQIRYQQQLNKMSLIRLQNIRNRISPHFIFNVLNRQITVDEDPSKHAEIFGLVKLLRQSLQMTESVTVSLNQEIEFVKSYLSLESSSMGNEFEAIWKLDENLNPENLKVPAMIIQIPVENALKHALRPKSGLKLLRISVFQVENWLKITIEDNGEGLNKDQSSLSKGTGTGLKVLYQTIDMLNVKNDNKIEFNLKSNSDQMYNGTIAEIKIPENYRFEN